MPTDPFKKTVDFLQQFKKTHTSPRADETAKAIEETTVVFADITGSTSLYEKMGDSRAQTFISSCLTLCSECVELKSGRVVKTIGDELMCAFKDPSMAAVACTDIQKLVREEFSDADSRFSMRIGMHTGSTIHENDDVFGDAVNLAARIASLAKPGQILTTARTVEKLSTRLRSDVRMIDRTSIRGKAEKVDIYELIWESAAEVTNQRHSVFMNRRPASRLQITMHDKTIIMEPNDPAIVIGRGKDAQLVTMHELVSREHARIESRRGRFLLVDVSTNGTYVCLDEDFPTFLRRDEFLLTGSGKISAGCRFADADDVITFQCEETDRSVY